MAQQNEVLAVLEAAGATFTSGVMKYTLIFKDLGSNRKFNFVRNVSDRESHASLEKSLRATGFRMDLLSKVNDLSLSELFDFESVKSTDRIFSLSLDEVQFGNGEKEMRVMFINNKRGRAFNNLAKTSDLEGFLNNLP